MSYPDRLDGDETDAALMELARELVGELAGGKVMELMLASQGASPHSAAGRSLAGARWNKGIPSAIDGRPVKAVLTHPQSPTVLYDLDGGHFAEGAPGSAPGQVMHSPQFSQAALASTGWAAKQLKADQDAGAPDPDPDAPGAPAGSPKPEDKVSKASVGYEAAADPAKSCHTCAMSYGPEDNRRCQLVAGQIYPTDTCDRWTPKDASGDDTEGTSDGTAAGTEQGAGNGEAAGQDATGADTEPDTKGDSKAGGALRRAAPEAAALAHQQAEDKVARALAAGRGTDEAHTLDGHGQIWTPQRASAHAEIVQDILRRSETVPSEGKAVLLAGLGTAKASALARSGAIDPARHTLVSTEHIKGELARRGMIPEIEGLHQGESTALVHAEAAHVAGMAASALASRRKNMVLDGSVPGGHAQDWAAHLRSRGYSDVRGVHLSTPVDKAVDRARSAHRSGLGKDQEPGPRLIPAHALRDASGSHGTDGTEQAFEALKPHLDGWEKHDHSGAAPVLAAKGGKAPAAGIRSVEDFTAARGSRG